MGWMSNSLDHFYGRMVIVTEQIDVNQFALDSDYLDTSKKDTISNWNHSCIQQLHSILQQDISNGITLVCGFLF